MRIPKKLYIGVASLLVAVSAFVGLMSLTTPADAMTITDRADCGFTDPIINCGAQSTEELLQKFNANSDGRTPANHDIQAIFNHYGISRSMLADTNNIKHGYLNHIDGTVSVDGKVVATGAKSLYRVKVEGKSLSPVSINGKTYYIGNVAGQYKYGAEVFVFYKNGKPFVAVQASCGNPIPIIPKEEPKPVYSCDSLQATKIERTKFEFTSTATARNGAQIVNYNYDFGDGVKVNNQPNKVSHTYTKAGTYNVVMTVNIRVDGQIKVVPGNNCKTIVKVDEEQKAPEFKCESLTKTKQISRTKFQFTAKSSGSNGAVFKDYIYDFGNGPTAPTTQSVVDHEFPAPGTYKVKVTARYTVNGTVESKTSPNCEVTIKVEEKPETPVYKCDSLTAQLITSKDRTYAYTLEYTAEGGATFTKATYDFGDGTSETFTTPASATSVQHTYAQPGNYTTTTTLYFNDGTGKEVTDKSKNCEAKIVITEEPCPTNPQYPKDSPECAPCPYNPELPKDSPDCEETPPELPKTGLDMFIGGGLGLGSISAAGYYWSASRRNLLDALLKK